jgi:hypothetical protein
VLYSARIKTAKTEYGLKERGLAMFITVIHRISDPDRFESIANATALKIPSHLKASRTHRSEVVALALVVAAVLVRAQGGEFTRGEMQFSKEGQHYQLALSKISGASSLIAAGTGKFILGLVYKGEKRGAVTPDVHFALTVGGPGKYGKAAIQNFVVQTDLLHPWNFSRTKDDCIFDLARVDKSSVEGTVICTTAVPFSAMKFNAMP